MGVTYILSAALCAFILTTANAQGNSNGSGATSHASASVSSGGSGSPLGGSSTTNGGGGSSGGGGGGSAPSTTQLPPPPAPGWVRGRTTYYGGPDLLAEAYDPARGKGSFGILTFGSCGFTNSDNSLPFPQDAVAAAADADPDYAGSCGRCYQVKCVNGLVAASNNTPVRIINGSYDGDTMRPYLPAINPNITDTRGRPWPGNPDQGQGLQFVKCWNDSGAITVRIIDSCPCRQVLADTAPGVKKGGEVRRQEWCCGGQNHFDLSYWAFEKLAHPVYGVMSVDYRPVNCDTNEPLAPPPAPGYVSRVVYDNVVEPGWSWYPYDRAYAELIQQGAGLNGSAATCLQLSPGGGLSFTCRACGGPGYQPFANASAISFWIRPNSNSTDPYFSSTPSGVLPPLKLFVLQDGSLPVANGTKQFCGNEVYFNSTSPAATQGEWFKLVVPLSVFRCPEVGVPLERLNRLEFQNVGERDAHVCLDQIELI